MNSASSTPIRPQAKQSARLRIFSSEKRYHHASRMTHQADDAMTQMQHSVLRNEQWIYL